MTLIDIVALLAILQYIFIGGAVGRARGRFGVKAPAVTGHEQFERLYRVQTNTLELLVALLPTLYIAQRYLPTLLVAGAGAVYLLGRLVYWRAYVRDPSTRSLGFALSMFPVFGLALTALVFAALSSWRG